MEIMVLVWKLWFSMEIMVLVQTLSRSSWFLTGSDTQWLDSGGSELDENDNFSLLLYNVGLAALVITRKQQKKETKICSWNPASKHQENKLFDFQGTLNIFSRKEKQGFLLTVSPEELGMLHRAARL